MCEKQSYNRSTLAQEFEQLFQRLSTLSQKDWGEDVLCDVLYDMCLSIPNHNYATFMLDEDSVNQVMKQLETELQVKCPQFKSVQMPVSYLLEELICNIQQHAEADNGQLFYNYDENYRYIEIALADHGRSIYGSYVHANKFLDLIGNSDAAALSLAKDGYSTKNRPNAENRGYGISSNIRIVTEGLKGEFALYSGNALFLKTCDETKLLELPETLDMKGTIVAVRIPTDIPNEFDFYKYVS